MKKKVKELYVTPVSETLEVFSKGFLCASQTRSAMQDYEVQEEEDW